MPGQQVLDEFAYLHELIEARRLGDESGYPQIHEPGPVSLGLGRAPCAHRNPDQVFGVSYFAQDVFATVPREV